MRILRTSHKNDLDPYCSQLLLETFLGLWGFLTLCQFTTTSEIVWVQAIALSVLMWCHNKDKLWQNREWEKRREEGRKGLSLLLLDSNTKIKQKKECLWIMVWEQNIVSSICFYTATKNIQCLEWYREDKTLPSISKINSHQYLSSQCNNIFSKYQEPSDSTRLLFCS